MRKIEGREAELERLAGEIKTARSALARAGTALRKARAAAAPKLAKSVRQNLADLGFRQSEFEAKIVPNDEPRLSGTESLELLFSPNPGEPLKPLRMIASSGEISRLMLAIKSSLAMQDAIPLLVFDEIDANVGGEIANAVGAKMRALASETSGALHHAFAAGGGRRRDDAFRRDQGSRARAHVLGLARGERQSAPGRNRADARRQERLGAQTRGQSARPVIPSPRRRRGTSPKVLGGANMGQRDQDLWGGPSARFACFGMTKVREGVAWPAGDTAVSERSFRRAKRLHRR